MAELLVVLWWPAALFAGLGAVQSLARYLADPYRRCLSCGRPVWPWSRQGWRVTAGGTLRWHGGRCRV